MRSWKLLVAISSVLFLVSTAGADTSPAFANPDESAAVVDSEDFDDPESDPTTLDQPAALDPDSTLLENSAEVDPDPAASASTPGTDARSGMIPLGPLVVNADGVEGRIHVVSTGETLWDISDAYLGTPWVWPSVWNENSEIENPHLIRPGDRLWITSTEMRVISRQEADDMLRVAAPLDPLPLEPEVPVPSEDSVAAQTPIPAAEPEPEELPMAVPLQASGKPETGRVVPVSWRESLNFVSPEKLEGASSIVGSPVLRTWLAQEDPVYIGLGEGEVSVGDQFTVFRDVEEVVDPDTGGVVGYNIDVLGWLEVKEVAAESSLAEVRISISEIARGDRIMRREPPSRNVTVKMAQGNVEAKIIYTPIQRTMMGPCDYVYLNRGSVHGLEVGTELEVFEAGSEQFEHVRNIAVRTPDNIVADLVVVTLQPETAVAYVTATTRELEVGDVVRGSSRRGRLAQAPSPAL